MKYIYEIMSRVRLEQCERNRKFMPSEARLKKFEKNIGPKIHSFAFKLYTGASKSGGRGGGPPRPPPDPLVLIRVQIGSRILLLIKIAQESLEF